MKHVDVRVDLQTQPTDTWRGQKFSKGRTGVGSYATSRRGSIRDRRTADTMNNYCDAAAFFDPVT